MPESTPMRGIRKRRHEAARQELEAAGWKQQRQDADGCRHYRHPKRKGRWLMVGAGGAVYWTSGRSGRVVTHADARDGEEVASAQNAARAVR